MKSKLSKTYHRNAFTIALNNIKRSVLKTLNDEMNGSRSINFTANDSFNHGTIKPF